jgi:hypothetical protein
MSLTLLLRLLLSVFHAAVTKEAKYKGDIFMVFDYAEHDLTGMVDAVKTTTGLSPAQVRPCDECIDRIPLTYVLPLPLVT